MKWPRPRQRDGTRSNFGAFAAQFGHAYALMAYGTVRGFGVETLVVPGIGHPIKIRRRTSDWECAAQVFAHRVYEAPDISTPRLIIDAGANVGYASIWFASRYPQARIIAVEPDPENAAPLIANTVLYPSIRPTRAAVWTDDETRFRISNPTASGWARRVEAEPNGSVCSVSLGSLLRDSGYDTVDILKIDIEGAERTIFNDSSVDSWLPHTRLLFVETHDRLVPGSRAAVLDAAKKYELAFLCRNNDVDVFRRM